MDSVVNHIRTATQVTLLSGDDSKAEIAGSQPFNYFFIDGTALYHAKYDESKDSHTILKITDKLAPDNSEFTRIKDDLLGITLASENSGQTYLVNSETLLMNFSLLNKGLKDLGRRELYRQKQVQKLSCLQPPSPAQRLLPRQALRQRLPSQAHSHLLHSPNRHRFRYPLMPPNLSGEAILSIMEFIMQAL